jgi:cytochrome P450 family 709
MGLFSFDRSVNERIARYKAVATQAIESRLNSNDLKETMLEVIKEQGILGKEGEYDMDRLVQEFMGFFVAGVDTTSQLLTMSFYYLGKYPEWQARLRKEISDSGVLAALEQKPISQLRQLEVFIKEVFRHSNYVVSVFPRRCLKSHQLGDIHIQEGYY